MLILRFFEIYVLLIIFLLVCPIFFIILIILYFYNKGKIFYVSKRVGYKSKIFNMYKFRTMKIESPEIATHLLVSQDQYITKFGHFLRRFSLDEIPQLLNILKGEMTFIGPRPALFNQYDLINLRKKKFIDLIKPGITGWAQINGRDNLTIEEKVKMDAYYYNNKSLRLNLKIFFLTVYRVFKAKDIKH